MTSPVAGYPLVMNRNQRVRAVGAGAALAVALSGCAASPEIESSPVGANTTAEAIQLSNVLVDPPPEGGSYRPHESAVVRFTVFNQASRPDELKSVEAGVATEVRLMWDQDCDGTASPASVLPVEANGTVPDPMGDPPFVGTVYFLRMEGLKEEIRAGTTVPLVFEFEDAGTIAVAAPVLTGEDATLPPLGCRHE